MRHLDTRGIAPELNWQGEVLYVRCGIKELGCFRRWRTVDVKLASMDSSWTRNTMSD